MLMKYINIEMLGHMLHRVFFNVTVDWLQGQFFEFFYNIRLTVGGIYTSLRRNLSSLIPDTLLPHSVSGSALKCGLTRWVKVQHAQP